jgi:formiminotetrahydrofolate cyclodeaminase
LRASSHLHLQLEELLGEVASADPAPGGGFVAGVTVALAAGLVTMAARLSGERWADAGGAAAQAEALRSRAAGLAERNAEAYLQAVAALKDRAPEPGGRDDQIARALEQAAEIPLEIADAAADVASLAAAVAESGEPSLRADVAIAALLSVAAAQGAQALIEVNLGTTSADERVAEVRELVAAASAAAQRALEAVE